MSSDITERPPRRSRDRMPERGGVVELPWQDEKSGQPEPERQEARECRSEDQKPKPAPGPPRENQEADQPPPPEQESIWKRVWPVIAGLIVLGIIAGLVWWAIKPSESKVSYTFTKATVATVTVTAHAEGRLAARNPVDVVAPTGARLDSAPVKSGDHVRQGQILVRLNSETAREDIVDANGEIAASQSSVTRADADVTEARAVLMRAKSSTAPGEVDTAQARLARAVARADEARALLVAVRSRLAAARAKLDGLVVRAPFDAIVLKSSLDTPEPVHTVARGQSLFTLVRSLSALDLTVDFPENAIGPLHVGQRAFFTAPAFPHRTFSATLNGISTSSKIAHKEGAGDVVTYAGTLSAENSDGSLRPGMSADVAVVLAQAKDVLTVPNAALMFRPAANVEAKFPSPIGAQAAPLPPSIPAPGASTSSLGPLASPAASWSPVVLSSSPRAGRVWVLEGDKPRPRDIMVGLSDGNVTQVISGELRAGDAVITSALVQAGGNGSHS